MNRHEGLRPGLAAGMMFGCMASALGLACKTPPAPRDTASAPPRAESFADAASSEADAAAPAPAATATHVPAAITARVPVDHLDKIARYAGFQDAVTVGGQLVLVGCHKLRFVAEGSAGHDVRFGDQRGPCASLVGSDEARVYLLAPGQRTTLVAFDVSTASKVWEAGPRVGSVTLRDDPREICVAGPIVAASDAVGQVVALAANDGHVVWTAEGRDGGAAPGKPLVRSGDLILRYPADRRFGEALDARTGRVVWQIPASAGSISDVAASEQMIALAVVSTGARGADERQTLVILDPRSGVVTHTWLLGNDPVRGYLTVAGDALYMSGRGPTQRIDPTAGQVLWTAEPTDAPIAVSGDAVFLHAPGMVLHALDATTGTRLWTYGIAAPRDPEDDAQAAPTLIDDPIHPGEQLLVGLAARHASPFDDHDLILFRRGDSAVHPRSARIEGVVRGGNPGDSAQVDGKPVAIDDKLRFAATVEARGTVLVAPPAGNSGMDVARAIDMETGEPLYKVGLVIHPFEQSCR